MTDTNMKEIVAQAEKAVESVKEPSLKKVAFETVLSHLLGASTVAPVKPQGRQHGAVAAARHNRPQLERAPTGRKSGLMSRLQELVDEDFFEKPKPLTDVVSALAERACHVRQTDLTWQMAKLVDDRVLRRKKATVGKGGRSVWAYSNW